MLQGEMRKRLHWTRTHFIFFCSAGARDKWSQSPIKETGLSLQHSVHKEACWESYVSLRKSQLASQVQKWSIVMQSVDVEAKESERDNTAVKSTQWSGSGEG